MRRPIVAELSSAGMSTRAIAPIVGASQRTVVNDVGWSAGEQSCSPDREPYVNRETGEIYETTADYQAEPQKITGMDGKQYPKPAPAASRCVQYCRGKSVGHPTFTHLFQRNPTETNESNTVGQTPEFREI